MRVTKKMLRDTKGSMIRRIKELGMMTDYEVVQEYKRCFPDRKLPEGRPGEVVLHSVLQKRVELLTDLVHLAIPDHWFE